VATVVLALAPTARAQGGASGIQVTLDLDRVLVSKDVAGARWAITFDRTTDAAIGNVFFPDGGEPGFLFCRKQLIGNVFNCFGAGPCAGGRCTSDFGVVGAVELPEDFFDPSRATSAASLPRSVVVDASAVPAAAVPAQNRPSGRQATPDGAYVIVSKDVAGARWAITYDRDDATVTGNVFFPDGGAPVFLSCDPVQPPTRFACFGADACATELCTDQYSFIAIVDLPSDFLGSPTATCGNGVEEPGERCERGAGCEFLCGIDGFCTIEIGFAPVPILGTCNADCSRCDAL
jgi:hypothetical protein